MLRQFPGVTYTFLNGGCGNKIRSHGHLPFNQSLWGSLMFKIWGVTSKSKQIEWLCLLHMNYADISVISFTIRSKSLVHT